MIVLIGSPHNIISWQEVEADLLEAERADNYQLPWEGRAICFM